MNVKPLPHAATNDRAPYGVDPAPAEIEIHIPDDDGPDDAEIMRLFGIADPSAPIIRRAKLPFERRVQDRALRNLVLVSHLMALKLAQWDLTADNDFAREVRTLLDAHELAVDGIRRDLDTALDGRFAHLGDRHA